METTDTHASAGSTTGESAAGRNGGLMNRVRERATEQLSTQKERATTGLDAVAEAVRQSTGPLREQQHDALAGYVESAANQIDRLSQRLREKEVVELVNDAQRLARRRPAVFIGSAFMLGLITARFFRSSPREDEYGELDYSGSLSPPRPGMATSTGVPVASVPWTTDPGVETRGAGASPPPLTASTGGAGTTVGRAKRRPSESERS